MEIFGVIALFIALFYSPATEKVKRLEIKLKQIERKQKGESIMSKLISELAGKECKIKCEEALSLVGNEEMVCSVLDTDDEWIKVQVVNKKKNQIIKLIRIENIEEIEILEEE